VALVVVVLLAGIAIGAVTTATLSAEDAEEILAAEEEVTHLRAAVDNAEERMWKLYRERESLQEQLDAAGQASDSAQTTDGVLSDGIYLVGEDIEPGEYSGELVAETGYWARLKNTDGTVNSIITNRLVTGPFVVTVIESDQALELRGVLITLE